MTVGRGVGADFSRTCEGCAHITAEDAGKGQLWHRCSAPGPRRGYTVSTAGRFLPYVPAWCPLMEANKKDGLPGLPILARSWNCCTLKLGTLWGIVLYILILPLLLLFVNSFS